MKTYFIFYLKTTKTKQTLNRGALHDQAMLLPEDKDIENENSCSMCEIPLYGLVVREIP